MAKRVTGTVLRSTNKTVFLILAALFVLKVPVLNTPHYWDALLYVIPAGVWYSEHSPLSIPKPDYGHPPLFFWLLGLDFRIFGYNLYTAHLINLIFAFLGVWFVFLLGKHLQSQRVGLIAAFLLFFSPMYFAQAGILNIDMALASLTIASLYFAIKNDLREYLLSAIPLVLVKEVGVFLVIAIAPYIWKKYGVKRLLPYLSPALVLLLWLLFYKLSTANLLYQAHVNSMVTWLSNPQLFWNFFKMFFDLVFVSDFKFLVSLAIVLAIILYKKTKLQPRLEYLPLVLLMVIYFIFFSSYDQALPRHILPALPVFFVLGSIATEALFGRYAPIVAALLIGMFLLSWHGDRPDACGCSLETNMEYLDLIKTHQEAVNFIAHDYPNATILTGWPGIVELTMPAAGYVSKPLNAKAPYYSYFAQFDYPMYQKKEKPDIAYYSPQSNIFQNRDVMDIIVSHNMTMLKRFGYNNKIAIIYH